MGIYTTDLQTLSVGLFVLRLVIGVVMMGHGAQKLFGWFGGGGIGGTAPFMEQLGFRPARLHAFLAGSSELVAGLFLAVGLLTPVASAIAFATAGAPGLPG